MFGFQVVGETWYWQWPLRRVIHTPLETGETSRELLDTNDNKPYCTDTVLVRIFFILLQCPFCSPSHDSRHTNRAYV
jgi:hypothetical protein